MEFLLMPTVRRSRLFACLTSRAARLALGLGLAGWMLSANAFFSLGMIPGIYIPQTYYKFGAVYTRAIVPGPGGRPVYVEYGTDGKEAREIGEAVGQYERAKVMPGGSYRSLLQRLKDSQERNPEQVVMKAEDYKGQSFKTVGGEAITKPDLAADTLTVVVRPDKQRFLKNGNDLLLLELPIDTNNQPSSSSKALLLSDKGEILHQTDNTIGFRVGFFGKDGKVSDSRYRRPGQDKIYGALPNVGVTLGGWVSGGYAITDDQGKFVMHYFLPACPGFTFDYTTDIYLELYYKRFNPRSKSHMPYYMSRPGYDFCFGLGVYSLDAMMIGLSIAMPVKQPDDFPIDLMVLDGGATLKNAKLGEKTAYNAETSDYKKQTQEKYDFDGDEKPDWVAPGKKVKKTIDGKEKEVFVTTAVDQAELQGIYLSSRYDAIPADTETTAPDFTRLIDTAADFKDRGLLSTISKGDLRDTDIYVFRESNGQLVAERRGLHENELYKNLSGVDEKEGSFRYTIQLRGAVENYYNISYDKRGEAGFKKWQSAGGFKEEFQKRTANHLKAGETVRIIAINRPTGYMGSVRVPLQTATASGNFLSFPGQRIELAPPNLKLWAERKSKIERGMTKGEDRKQLIGSEGAGLGSDVSIAIYSDWRDQDGSPLPEELADYGYTGRLAKIVAENQLAPSGVNNLSQFKIKPGQQVQVIQLPEKVLAKQHLYLQVAGQPDNRNPDFASGAGTGILKYRPNHYVPVKVPLHDEEASEISRQAYQKAKKKDPKLDLKKPEPLYTWQYRPEMQFSLYELNVKEVRRVDAKDVAGDIYGDKTPTMTSSDRYVSFIYKLLKSSLGTLDSFSYKGERELVLAFGQEEIKATVGESQNIKFENIAHLGALDADDFLSLRLYANNDAGNVLFEFAFEQLVLNSSIIGYNNQTDDTWYVSADDPKVNLQAYLVGYAARNSKIKKPLNLTWKVEGDGSMTSAFQTDSDLGIFENQLTMPTKAGSSGIVKALLRESQTEALFKKVKVIPGKPASIEINASGTAAAMESDKLQMVITVKDAYGNTVQDGTSVDISINQDALVPLYAPGTINGVATATITGNAFAVPQAKMTVKSGTVTKAYDFEIEGLKVKILNSPSNLFVGRQENLQFQVTTTSGKPAANVLVNVSSNLGYFKESQFQTDASGNINAPFNTGPATGNGTWKIRAGFAGGTTQDFTISSPGGHTQADVQDLMLLGDKPSGGTVTYSRYDGTDINLDYQTQGALKIKGQAQSTAQVRLGDLTDPNLEPLLAYYMNDLEDTDQDPDAPTTDLSGIPDELGLRSGKGANLTVVADHPMGRGSSYLFNGSARIEVASDATLAKANHTGFRIDFKASEAAGEIFNLGQGQRLVLSGNTLRYEIETDNGSFSVEKTGVDLHEWHSAGGRYVDGQLELQVDNQLVAAPANGAVQYSGSKLTLGQNYQGNLNSFRLYDWAAQPLVQLVGGGLTQAVVLDGSGDATLVVESTGRLGALQSNSALRNLRIAIAVGGTRQFVSMLSSVAYIELAAQYLDTNSSAAPPIALNDLGYHPAWLTRLALAPVDYLVPKAYAEGFSAWGFIKGAVNFLIPLEDFKILGEQLYYLATGDWEKFNAMELTFAALGVATILPVMKPLKPVLGPIKAFIRRYGKNPIVKALAAVLGRATEEAVKGRTEKLVALLPYFLIVAEMLETPEGPEAILAMVNSIESADDLWAWIDFFNLPTDGWEDGELDSPSTVYVPQSPGAAERFTASIIEYFIPSAYAKKVKLSRNREKGQEAAKKIAEAAKLAGDPKDFVVLFKTLVKTLKDKDAGVIRKLAHSRALLIAGLGVIKKQGGSAVTALIIPQPGDRVSRAALIAAIVYLEESLKNRKDLELKVLTLYGLALVSKDEIQRHGGTFHLMMLAYLQALHEFAGDPPILEIEATQVIQYVSGAGTPLKSYGRRIDIVLGTPQEQVWVEVKSLRDDRFTSAGSSAFKPKGHYHREFYADLMATNGLLKAKKVSAKWRFHQFKTKQAGIQGPTPAEFSNFKPKQYLCLPDTGVSVDKSLNNNALKAAELAVLCKAAPEVKLQTNMLMLFDILKSKGVTDVLKGIVEDSEK